MKPLTRRPHGLSLIELMVGLAIGMAVVAVALLVTAHQLRDTGRLQREQRLVQDLRAAADMIARDLRRIGYWRQAETGVWMGAGAVHRRNPHATSFTEGNTGGAGEADPGTDQVDFSYSTGDDNEAVPGPDEQPDTVGTNERFGYRLSNGVIQVHLGGAGWQALTDPGVLTVTDLKLSPHLQTVVFDGVCARACPPIATPGAEMCPPRQEITHVDVRIVARAVSDPRFVSRANARARLRNDVLSGACPP